MTTNKPKPKTAKTLKSQIDSKSSDKKTFYNRVVENFLTEFLIVLDQNSQPGLNRIKEILEKEKLIN